MADTATIFISALVGGVVSYAGALFKGAIDARAQVDADVRRVRGRAYRGLWKTTGHLPKWPPATDVTKGSLFEMSCALRSWYFGVDRTCGNALSAPEASREPTEVAGMYLSRESMNRYSDLQDALASISLKGSTAPVPPDGSDYKKVRDLCSKLRSELTNDLLSRKRGALEELEPGG